MIISILLSIIMIIKIIKQSIKNFYVCLFVIVFILSLEYKESIYMTFGFCVSCRISKLIEELKKTHRKMEDYKTR